MATEQTMDNMGQMLPFALWDVTFFRFFVALSALLVVVALKRRYLSPLSNVPGPFISTISGILWHVVHTLRGDVQKVTMELHQKNGTFVRIGFNEVSVSHPDAVDRLLLAKLRKGNFYQAFSFPDDRFINQMSELDPHRHILKNKNIIAGYHLSNVIKSEPLIDEAIELLEGHLDRLSEDGEASIQLSRWFNYFAFDVVGEVTFSRRFGFLETGLDIGDAYANGRAVLIYICLTGRAYWTHKFLLANPLLRRLGLQPTNHLFETTQLAIEGRKQNPEARRDMMEQWLQMRRNHPDRMAEKEIYEAAVGNVAAGSDTVSAAIQAFFYYLLKNPRHLARLRQEIDNAHCRGELSRFISYSEAQKLPFLQACIREAYRFFPSVAFHYPRVAGPEGITIAGKLFPKGVTVSIHPWVIHRDTTIFGHDAAIFNPERWLDEERTKLMSKYLIHWGAGYNQCPGRQLAHLEISKLTANLTLHFDINLEDPNREWTVKNHFLISSTDWPCRLKRRDLTELVDMSA